jgi:hypothetical protein
MLWLRKCLQANRTTVLIQSLRGMVAGVRIANRAFQYPLEKSE